MGGVNGIRPLSNFGHTKTGSCGICGIFGPLTWTHVPPHCAGNVQPASAVVTKPGANSKLVIGAGRPKDGGAARYLLCGGCNNLSGRLYDLAFGQLWHRLAKRLLVDGGMPPYGGPYTMTENQVDPGAFVRSVLAGMMALNPVLRVDFPELQRAVLEQLPVAPPPDLYLLLALNPDLNLRAAGGKLVRQPTLYGRPLKEVVSLAEICWAPLYMVLTDQSGRAEWPSAQPILEWLLDAPEQRRTVDLLLPVLRPEQLHTHGMYGSTVVGRNGGMTATWSSTPHSAGSTKGSDGGTP